MTTTRTSVLIVAGGALLAGTLLGSGAIAQDKIKIGFSQGTMESSWRVNMVERNKKWHEANIADKADLIITNGENDASKQVADVESLLAQGIKILVISPVTADALTPVVKQAMDAGVKVLTLDRSVNTPVTSHIGADNILIGTTAGQFVCKLLGGKGTVGEIQGVAGASATVDRHDAFNATIAKECPDVKVVADGIGDYVREPAMKLTEDWIQRFPEGQLDVIYAHNDGMALGAVAALEAAGRLDDVKVVGIDGEEAAYQAIKDGKMAATFTYHFVAPEGMMYAWDVASGKTLDAKIVLPTAQIDATNVDKFLGTGF
jgi:ribose transport system substrate-binding protein